MNDNFERWFKALWVVGVLITVAFWIAAIFLMVSGAVWLVN